MNNCGWAKPTPEKTDTRYECPFFYLICFCTIHYKNYHAIFNNQIRPSKQMKNKKEPLSQTGAYLSYMTVCESGSAAVIRCLATLFDY